MSSVYKNLAWTHLNQGYVACRRNILPCLTFRVGTCLTDDIISALLYKAVLDKFFNPLVSVYLFSRLSFVNLGLKKSFLQNYDKPGLCLVVALFRILIILPFKCFALLKLVKLHWPLLTSLHLLSPKSLHQGRTV